MNVYHLSRDLMLVAKVSSAARSAGTKFQSASSPARLIKSIQQYLSNATVDEAGVRVLVDLQIPGLEIVEFKKQLDEISGSVEVIVYAQHVMTDLIDAANASKIGRVMTRGQFDRKVSELVR